MIKAATAWYINTHNNIFLKKLVIIRIGGGVININYNCSILII